MQDTFCVEAAVDGLLLLASAQVFSVEMDRSSRLFVVDIDEGEHEERRLASDMDAISRDGFLELICF
jgi:hypothetical protein